MTEPNRALIVCVGNDLVADDAAGPLVFDHLQRTGVPAGTRLECVGVGGLHLLDYLEGGEQTMVVVDAVWFGAPPGTVHTLAWDQLPSPGPGPMISVHAIGLRETIDIGRIVCPERIPEQITLVGIEGRCFDRMRDRITPAVAAAIPAAALRVRELLTNPSPGNGHAAER